MTSHPALWGSGKAVGEGISGEWGKPKLGRSAGESQTMGRRGEMLKADKRLRGGHRGFLMQGRKVGIKGQIH